MDRANRAVSTLSPLLGLPAPPRRTSAIYRRTWHWDRRDPAPLAVETVSRLRLPLVGPCCDHSFRAARASVL